MNTGVQCWGHFGGFDGASVCYVLFRGTAAALTNKSGGFLSPQLWHRLYI